MRHLRMPLLLLICFNTAIVGATTAVPEDPYLLKIDVRPWIEALRTDDLFEVDPAIDALAALGDRAIPALTHALRNEAKQARINLVEVLRDIRTPATAVALTEAARDTEAEVRADAVEALGKLGHKSGQAAIEAALDDPNPKVSTVAARSCHRLCTSPKALRRLVEMSISQAPRGRAGAAMSSLKRLRRDRHVSDLIKQHVKEVVEPVLLDTGAGNRKHAALVAATSGLPASISVLNDCATDKANPLLAVECVQALGESGSRQAVAPLVELTKSEIPHLPPAACRSLIILARTVETARPGAAECKARRQAKAAERKRKREAQR